MPLWKLELSVKFTARPAAVRVRLAVSLPLLSARSREWVGMVRGLKNTFSFFLGGFRGPFGLLVAAAAAAAWDRFLPPSTAQTIATHPSAKFTLGFHYL